MKTNLSSQITLDRVSPRYYRPGGNIERSVLTRFEKLPTDIYATSEEGVKSEREKMAAVWPLVTAFPLSRWKAAVQMSVPLRTLPLMQCL